jgi:hypothetical protein
VRLALAATEIPGGGRAQLAFAVDGLAMLEGCVGFGRGSLRELRLYSLRFSGILVRLMAILMWPPLKR